MGLPSTLGPFQALANQFATPEQFLQQIKTTPTTDSEGIKWIVDNLSNQTRSAIRRQLQAQQEKDNLKKQALASKINGLKQTPSTEYGDSYNQLTCQKLDQLQIQKDPRLARQDNQLAFAATLVKQELEKQIDDGELIGFLTQKIQRQKEKKMETWFRQGQNLLKNPQKAAAFASILFKIEQRKKEPTWGRKKLIKTLIAGLQGEKISLVSILCCINIYDYQGKYGLDSDLYAYQQKPQLPNIPSILDQLIDFRQLLELYGITTDLFIYIADTEYTQVEKFGPTTPEILGTLKNYTNNVRDYTAVKDNQTYVDPISELVDQDIEYQTIKAAVLRQVTSWRNSDFANKWYQPFERYFESMNERIGKRGIFPKSQVRQKSKEITQRRWAVNAAEGAVLSSLGENILLLSTETRTKDQTYVIDKNTSKRFPAVVYIIN